MGHKPNVKSLGLILSRCSLSPTSDCLEWQRSLDGKGYGLVRIYGKIHKPHRVVWEMHHGTIPPGVMVCHKCDNPKCCEISHLFAGTNQDNMDDKKAKGRAAKKLNLKMARAIKKDNRPQPEIAAEYGIAQQTVSDIKKARYWRDA